MSQQIWWEPHDPNHVAKLQPPTRKKISGKCLLLVDHTSGNFFWFWVLVFFTSRYLRGDTMLKLSWPDWNISHWLRNIGELQTFQSDKLRTRTIAQLNQKSHTTRFWAFGMLAVCSCFETTIAAWMQRLGSCALQGRYRISCPRTTVGKKGLGAF